MSGVIYPCPDCLVGDESRAMIPRGRSNEYRCGGCGHTIVESNPPYVSIRSHCKDASPKERIILSKTPRKS
jgi:hypothetical protein